MVYFTIINRRWIESLKPLDIWEEIYTVSYLCIYVLFHYNQSSLDGELKTTGYSGRTIHYKLPLTPTFYGFIPGFISQLLFKPLQALAPGSSGHKEDRILGCAPVKISPMTGPRC
jgi:hypothetical protein